MKKVILALLFASFITGSVYAQNLTLTTYYPSPQGKYAYMTLVPQDPPPQVECNENTIGTLFVEKPENILQFCRQDGGSGYAYGPIPGVWTQEDSTIFPSDVQDNNLVVGVGTDQPSARLDVRSANEIDILNLSDSTGEVLTVVDGGYVGIGVGEDEPESTLHVRDDEVVAGEPHLNNVFLIEGNVPADAGNTEGYIEMRLRNLGSQGSSKIVFEECNSPSDCQGDNFEIRYRSHHQWLRNYMEFWGEPGHRAKESGYQNCGDFNVDCCTLYGGCSPDGEPIMIIERDYIPDADNRHLVAGVGIGVNDGANLNAKLVVEGWGDEDILTLRDRSGEVLTVLGGDPGDTSGNVGIGVAEPAEKLEVDGKVKVGESVIYTPKDGDPAGWPDGQLGELAYSTQENVYYSWHGGPDWVKNSVGATTDTRIVAGAIDGHQSSGYNQGCLPFTGLAGTNDYSCVDLRSCAADPSCCPNGCTGGSVHEIFFDTPFNTIYSVTCTRLTHGPTSTCTVRNIDNNSFLVYTTSAGGDYTFIAVGE